MKLKKIVILTSENRRHLAFVDNLNSSKKIEILAAYIEKKNKKNIMKNKILSKHFKKRDQVEKKYFKIKNLSTKIKNLNFCERGYLSSIDCFKMLKDYEPDLIIVFGTSIIKGKIIKYFKDKILNVHLGLSPYYRGSGTNIFPLINNEPEFVGASIIFLDKGVDTGKIIHQIRAKFKPNDDVHQIGNRLIKEMFTVFKKIIINFEKIKFIKEINTKNIKYYKKKDFTEESVYVMQKNFKSGMIKNYLKEKKKRDNKVKLIQQNWI